MFLGMFLVAGPQIFYLFLKMRRQLSRALKKAGVTLEELDRKTDKKKGWLRTEKEQC